MKLTMYMLVSKWGKVDLRRERGEVHRRAAIEAWEGRKERDRKRGRVG